jgi:hypothetical protein
MKWNGTPGRHQFKAVTTGCITGTHNVRGRFDALHGPNGLCSKGRSVGFLKWGRGFAPRGLLLTTLLDCCAHLRKLDKDDVAQALLRIVRDGHGPDTGLIVVLDHLVILRVSFRWNRVVKPSRLLTRDWATDDSLTMVRLRVRKAEGKARRGDARWTRSALVRLDAYRRECILVQVCETRTRQVRSKARRGHAITYLRPLNSRGRYEIRPTDVR